MEGNYHERAKGCCVSQSNSIDTNSYHKYQRGFSNHNFQKVIKENCFLWLEGPEKTT